MNGVRSGNGIPQGEGSSQAAMNAPLSLSLEDNLNRVKETFTHCSDIQYRVLQLAGRKAVMIYLEGMTNQSELESNVLKPLMGVSSHETQSELTIVHLKEALLSLLSVDSAGDLATGVASILNGGCLLLVDGMNEGLLLKVTGGERRAVTEPTSEAVVRGPREGFTEDIGVNLALLRFKVKSVRLKTENFNRGRETNTRIVLCYLEGIAEPDVIEEARRRLSSIDVDGILESGYVEEFIEDSPYSPFPQLHYSERPDTVAAQLLEGRFAIFIDGTPFVLTAPITAWQMMQANEDYYERYLMATLLRILRLAFLFIALFMPALYVAIITFHQDMLPSNLIISMAAAREPIPFPALVEALIMEITFEALREAGIRLPKTVGQAVSIVGALVIGQASVEAGIVSAPMVIVVSITGIASFTIPRFNMAIAIRMLRFPLIILGGTLGLFGIIIGTVWIALHMCQLRSFGVPYLSGIAPSKRGEAMDILVRAPRWSMRRRPATYTDENIFRAGPNSSAGSSSSKR